MPEIRKGAPRPQATSTIVVFGVAAANGDVVLTIHRARYAASEVLLKAGGANIRGQGSLCAISEGTAAERGAFQSTRGQIEFTPNNLGQLRII